MILLLTQKRSTTLARDGPQLYDDDDQRTGRDANGSALSACGSPDVACIPLPGPVLRFENREVDYFHQFSCERAL